MINLNIFLDTKLKLSQEISSRKLLITICNLDYVINHSLSSICTRLSENGVKFTEIIWKNTKEKFLNYRQSLIKHYINIKINTILSVLETANYSELPCEEGNFFNFKFL